MSTSPLIPVPDLPYNIQDAYEEIVQVMAAAGGASVAAYQAGTFVGTQDAPTLAAAILAAAGCVNHRVIDLGGQLSALKPNGDGVGWYVGGMFYPADTDTSSLLAGIRQRLAVLEARAATPQHDPAEIQAVADVVETVDFDHGDVSPAEYATRILNALAKVRGEQR